MRIRQAEEVPHVEIEKEYYYSRLEKMSDDIHAGITFYEGLHEYILRFNFPESISRNYFRGGDVSNQGLCFGISQAEGGKIEKS
jgi:hypothetical protein